MAASDQTYRNQKGLHLVFAISSVAMLATTVWMFWDDYNRPFKKEQRVFREVEEELAKRDLLAAAPNDEQRKTVLNAEKEVADAQAVLKDVRAQADRDVRRLSADQVRAERNLADVKAVFDSMTSFFNIEVEQRGPASPEAKRYRGEMDRTREQMEKLKVEVERLQAQIDDTNRKPYTTKVGGTEEVTKTPRQAEEELSQAEARHKDQLDKTKAFDALVKSTVQKQGGLGYWVRQLPVVDAFASPVKIQQYTLDELPIDYSFKFVTRYDRCTTCHLGMEKPSYDKATLARLTTDPSQDEAIKQELTNASAAINERNKVIADYNRQVSSKDRKEPLPIGDKVLRPETVGRLSDARVNQFAAHPRLDLFVGANSPHPAEKFGCSICHGGQGSATDFVNAVHSPNDPLQRERWHKESGWELIHFWDFPMQPQRFVESGCVKCHHQVTDLIRDGNRVEAPKLVEGYNHVRELGCFGCHEFAGINKGRWVGPDLRLEPDPPIDSLPPEERAKRLSDPLNPPGTMRRVGPNLSRIAEKTHEEWTRQWIKSPRSFRPETKMPHYYGRPNNEPEVLPDDQKKFPDAEVASIAHYLFATSKDQLKQIHDHHNDAEDARKADADLRDKLIKDVSQPGLTDKQKHEFGVQLAEVRGRIAAREMAPLATDDVKLPPAPADDKAKAEQIERGRHLFSTRGCLACHMHGATMKEAGQLVGKPVPPIDSDRTFGPELTRLAAKLGTKAGDPQSARAWLVRWLLDPSKHNPRTYMPAPFHADEPATALQEADDVAAWLLTQPVQPADREFAPVAKPELDTLKNLARVWLQKSLTRHEMMEILDKGNGFSKEVIESKPADADERFLEGDLNDHPDKLMMYIGKKAINNLGCFGCHTIPGFESAKPIGTGLNDWGKKDPERLAFEDSEHFVEHHFDIVDVRRELTEREMKENEKLPPEKRARTWEGPRSYEKFYAEQLAHGHQTRVGFLHLKLQEPRSYDFNRVRGWDERLRMPQFKFARSRRLPEETESDYEKRASREEAEAREAVMTFVLGLTAEPVPAKYVNTPTGDKAALAKGRQVIDKFNCAGCHQIQPGIFEFKLTRDKVGEKDEEKDGQTVKVPVTARDLVLTKLEEMYNTVATDPGDFRFPEHNAWAGPEQKDSSRIRAYGVVRPEGAFVNDDLDKFGANEKNLLLRLARAVHFKNLKDEPRDIPAGAAEMLMPREVVAGMVEQFGGDFAGRLSKYLQAYDKETYGPPNDNKSVAAGPPSLVNEGEKAQPVWLFQFFRNPIKIRPLAVLRMPRFNMSGEDAQALVNYFAASSKTTNAGIGLIYPYLLVPERESSHLNTKETDYIARLKKANALETREKELQPVWAKETKERIADGESRLKSAKAAVEQAKKANQDAGPAEKQVAAIEADLRKWRAAVDTNDFSSLRQEYEAREAYVTDAFKLVANSELCLKCHQVGQVAALEQLGPQLGMTAERLRPDWLMYWLANPQRFLQHKTLMPQNFPANEKNYGDRFLGSEQSFSLDQIKAVRDFLMILPQVADWPVLKDRPAAGTAGGK
jgi:mono/diheme cytochrome c family protein